MMMADPPAHSQHMNVLKYLVDVFSGCGNHYMFATMIETIMDGDGSCNRIKVLGDPLRNLNSLTPKSVPAGTKKPRLEGFWLAKHKDTNIPTMMEPFSSPAAWF